MSDEQAAARPSLRARLQYKFDRTIAGGTGGLMLWLAGISGVVVAIAATILMLGVHPDGSPEELEKYNSYIESFWASLNVALDPGGIEEDGWGYRILMLSVAIIGVLIVSTVIGVLTAGIEGKLEDLRRGPPVLSTTSPLFSVGRARLLLCRSRIANEMSGLLWRTG